MSVLDATLLLPLYNGGTTLLVTLGTALLFRERLTKRQYLGILLGLIAIVLMSI
jgi:drug/metabolite transporter (DMT)-like permease